MKQFAGIVLLGIMILISVQPCVVTPLIALDTKYIQKDRRLQARLRFWTLAVSCGANLLVMLAAHRVLFHTWNPVNTLRRAVQMSVSYQEVKFFPILWAGTWGFAAVLGFVLRALLPKRCGRCFLSARRKNPLLMMGLVLAMMVIGTMFFSFNGIHGIVINEVSGYNGTAVLEETGTVGDYVELYNTGSLDWVVQELYLSDDAQNLRKLKLTDCTIPAKGYYTVALENTDLSVGRNGDETIYLSDDLGRIVDRIELPELRADIAYSRTADGAETWRLASQTPGSANAKAAGALDARVTLSHPGGFYQDAFYLTMETEGQYEIYYTLDGSVPSRESLKYTQPVRVYDRSGEPNLYRSLQRVVLNWKKYTPPETPVPKACLIRAAAVAEDGSVGEVVTATYFVGLEEFAGKNVVSLTADPEDLFGEDGVYVTGTDYDALYLAGEEPDKNLANFMHVGRGSEIRGHMEYYSGETALSQDLGLRISGGWARRDALKRFSLFPRNQYGSRTLEANLFGDITTRRVQIREGYANAAVQLLMQDRSVLTQQSIPVAVFVNGEFWYESNLIEKYDEHYFRQRYGIREDNIVICKNNVVNDWDEEDTKLRTAVYDFLASHDMTREESYEAFGQLVDLQSYIDFMCTNIYIHNIDFSEDHNSVWWRVRETSDAPYSDGKWRFALYDLDAMEWEDVRENAKKNIFTELRNGEQILNVQPIYAALKTNASFRRQFVLTFQDLVNENFQYENVQPVLDSYRNGMDNSGHHDFFRVRAQYILPCLAEEFSLTGTRETITLGKTGEGTVRLNTITPDLTEGDWSGQYYTDYPLTLTAIPAEGYAFAGWRGDIRSGEAEAEITLSTGGAAVYAVFEKIQP